MSRIGPNIEKQTKISDPLIDARDLKEIIKKKDCEAFERLYEEVDVRFRVIKDGKTKDYISEEQRSELETILAGALNDLDDLRPLFDGETADHTKTG